MPDIHEIIDRLSPELQHEVSEFALFLLEKYGEQKMPKGTPLFSWEGSLKGAYLEGSSVDLQHEIWSIRSEFPNDN